MAIIEPFCGIRYDPSRLPGQDASAVLAPPYDVLNERDRDALLARSEVNIVRIDLPHMPAKSAGPDEVYAQAAERLEQWLRDGTLVCDDEPALYVYHQRYRHEGRCYVRRMFFARLRLEPLGAGCIFAHERTFAGPKQDRLKLTQATGCHVSPVFGLYTDREGAVAAALDPGSREPDVAGSLDGVENLLWRQTDRDVIERVQRLLADKHVYIADGHHRYETALMYRDLLLDEQADLPDDHPARFVLVVLCGMEDPGLVILPTHRVLVRVPEKLDIRAALEQAGGPVRVVPAGSDRSGEQASCEPEAASGDHRFVVYDGRLDVAFAVHVRADDVMARLEPQRSAAWRSLNVAVLHRYVLEELLQPALGGDAPTIRYITDARAARQVARTEGGVVFELAPIRMDELRAVCEAGDLMPQKSTYFYPKLATGLVIHPLR